MSLRLVVNKTVYTPQSLSPAHAKGAPERCVRVPHGEAKDLDKQQGGGGEVRQAGQSLLDNDNAPKDWNVLLSGERSVRTQAKNSNSASRVRRRIWRRI